MKPARFTFLSNVVLFLHMEMIAQSNGVPAWGHVSAVAINIPVGTSWPCTWSDETKGTWPFETRFVRVATAPTIGAVCSGIPVKI